MDVNEGACIPHPQSSTGYLGRCASTHKGAIIELCVQVNKNILYEKAGRFGGNSGVQSRETRV